MASRERVLVSFAKKMTAVPAEMSDGDVETLRREGLGDEEVLMATPTAAYFNFVNRVVHTLGVEHESQPAHHNY